MSAGQHEPQHGACRLQRSKLAVGAPQDCRTVSSVHVFQRVGYKIQDTIEDGDVVSLAQLVTKNRLDIMNDPFSAVARGRQSAHRGVEHGGDERARGAFAGNVGHTEMQLVGYGLPYSKIIAT